MTLRNSCIDAFRGLLFINMFVYHSFVFADLYDLVESTIPFGQGWRIYQKLIAGGFLFVVGVSLYLGRPRFGDRTWQLRVGLLSGCAIVVSVTSYLIRSDWIVTFGILHCITVCYVIGSLSLRFDRLLILFPTGSFLIAVSVVYRDPLFNSALLSWTGFATQLQPSFDNQPLFQSLGLVFIGIAAGPIAANLPRGNHSLVRTLSVLGEHTLFLYMAHVPVILIVCALVSEV